jgi:hypothetical protein
MCKKIGLVSLPRAATSRQLDATKTVERVNVKSIESLGIHQEEDL